MCGGVWLSHMVGGKRICVDLSGEMARGDSEKNFKCPSAPVERILEGEGEGCHSSPNSDSNSSGDHMWVTSLVLTLVFSPL